MLILGIFLLMLAACAVSLFLRQRGVRLAYLWLILLLTILAAWIVLLLIPIDATNPFKIDHWFGSGTSAVSLIFRLDNLNWHIIFSFVSIIISFLLVSVIQLQGDLSLYGWMETILIISLGSLVFLAKDYWSILISWTLIDFLELYFYFRNRNLHHEGFLIHFLPKFIGSMILVYLISTSHQLNPISLFSKEISGIELMVLLASILHSGIITSRFEKIKDPITNFPHLLVRILSFVSSFFLLLFIKNIRLGLMAVAVLKIIFLGISIWGILRWSQSENAFDWPGDFLIAVGAICAYTFLVGVGKDLYYWLIITVLPVCWLFLYKKRSPNLLLLGVPVLYMLSGFPFSFTHQLIGNILSIGNWFDVAGLALPLVLLISGYINHALKVNNDDIGRLEPWFLAIYMVGLFFPTISMVAMVIKNPQPINDLIDTIILGSVILAVSFAIYFLILKPPGKVLKKINTAVKEEEKMPGTIEGLKNIIQPISSFIENGLRFASNLLEGDGGILWAIVILALFLTILRFQGEF